MGSARNETCDQAHRHLERLATALMIEPDLHTSVIRPSSGTPFLRVTRSGVARLTENISAAPMADAWHYWWSWSEPLGPVDDTGEAVRRIAYVLTPAGESDVG